MPATATKCSSGSTNTQREEGESGSQQSRSCPIESLSSTPTQLTDDQWTEVVRLLPKADNAHRLVCKWFKRKGIPVDPDVIYNDAVDHLRLIVTFTPKKKSDELKFFGQRLIRKEMKRRKTQREFTVDSQLDLEPDRSECRRSVVETLNQLPPMKVEHRNALLAVVNKNEGECICDVLNERRRKKWYETIRPKLERWAAESGLIDGGTGD